MCSISAYVQTLNEYPDAKNTSKIEITSKYSIEANIRCSPNLYQIKTHKWSDVQDCHQRLRSL